MPVTAYIGLGSNLGDRRDYLDRALRALDEHGAIQVEKVSSYRETEPVGGPPGQGAYLNAAAELRTDLSADDLLKVLLQVEQTLGRVRSERHGPRTIDLDLLLYGELVVEHPWLIVPHPLMHERLFVLEPLVEIAPQVVHPVFECTLRDLLWKLELNPAPERATGAIRAATSGGRRESQSEAAAAAPHRELAGLRALVTGSTSGIGRAIAMELATAGADVIVHGRRSEEIAEQVAGEIRSASVDSEVILADLRDAAACARLAEEAWNAWGHLDICINNAGADTLTGEAAKWSFERKLEELLDVDVTGTILLGRALGSRMKQRGRGVIVNIGWDKAEAGMEGDSGELFAASKGAVMAFTRSLALSLAPEVRVNCIAPGWIRTAWGESASTPWQERVRSETPLGRWGTAQDVAVAARWLVSPAAAFLTGQIIRVNGGAVR